ncbi:peptidase M16, partial [Xanthomonas citri pv. citri]|nr:peptidase M16 [Xanthomonas citri pv. citri]
MLLRAGELITAEKIELARKKKIGTFLKALNSPEYIANQFTRYAFLDMSLFDVVTVLEQITLEDVQNVIQEEIAADRLTVCKVVPKS